MGKELIVETKDLTKVYDGVTVVDKINLQITEGEIFGLLGPNGAGKTTTILMLMGLTEPSFGTVTVNGHDPAREPMAVKRQVGYMPEKVGFYEDLTARENLMFIAELNKIPAPKAEKKINELLRQVGISDVADSRVGKFSRGMKQRLGIADALIKEPKLVILDEPTAGLDPAGIKQILDFIEGLPKKGTTVVLSSHQLDQVKKVCRSIGIIVKGKLMKQDTIANLDRMARGGQFQIEVELKEPGAELLAKLIDKVGQLNGVTGVAVDGDNLLVTSVADLRPQLAKVVIDNEAALVKMDITKMTLEDIYLRYSRPEE